MSMNSYVVAAAAGLALTAAAVAQPASTDLGTLASGTLNVPNVTIGAGEIVWYRFTLANPIPAGGTLFLDIDTEGSSLAPSNDTELGLYDSTGVLIANDDDSGSGLLTQLTFGSTIPRPAVGTGLAYNGRNGGLTAGTYYLSISGFNSNFAATGWGVTSTSTNTGTGNINLALGQVVAGSCCLAGGCCTVTTPESCASQGGVYGGNNTSCGNCPGAVNYTLSTGIPGVFADISSTGTALGTGDDQSFAFTSAVTNALITNSSLFASTNGVISEAAFATYVNTALPVATLNVALFPFWDDLYVDPAVPSSLVVGTVQENGHDVQVVQWNNVRTFAGGTGSPTGTFEAKIYGNGQGPGGALVQFIYQSVSTFPAASANGASATIGVQSAGCQGFQFSFNSATLSDGMVVSVLPAAPPSICYPNCDGSTQNPFLNVLDFNCFLNRFTAGSSYANCDNSTQPPILNVLDFNCFLNRFTAGCSAP